MNTSSPATAPSQRNTVSDTIKKHWIPSVRTPSEIALMRAIKTQLDPHDIMNPGKLLP